MSITVLITIIAYMAAATMIGYRLTHGERLSLTHYRNHISVLGLVGLVAHGVTLLLDFIGTGTANIALTNAASLVSFMAVLLLFIASLARPLGTLGIIVLPLAAASVFAAWTFPATRTVDSASGAQAVHLAVSLLAYSLLLLAALQSILLLIQERHLRRHQPGGFMRALPPLETMEQLLFQMLIAGFIFLSISLSSGLFFSELLFGRPLRLSHHTILSIAAWIVFAALLYGRWRLGWRGRTAIHWTLGGFTLLALAYFGTKFVSEIILGR